MGHNIVKWTVVSSNSGDKRECEWEFVCVCAFTFNLNNGQLYCSLNLNQRSAEGVWCKESVSQKTWKTWGVSHSCTLETENLMLKGNQRSYIVSNVTSTKK